MTLYVVLGNQDHEHAYPAFKSVWSTRELAEEEVAREESEFLRSFLGIREVTLDASCEFSWTLDPS